MCIRDRYIAAALQLDPSAALIFDAKSALRDVLKVTAPAIWLRTEAAVQAAEDQLAKQQEQQNTLQAMQQGSEVVGTLAGAAKDRAAAQAQTAGTPV